MARPHIRPIRQDLVGLFELAQSESRCLLARSRSEEHRLNDAVRRGQVISPVPQVYALPDYWQTLKAGDRHMHILRALGILHPDWTFCGPSAALAFGLSVSNRMLSNIHVATTQRAHSRDRRGISRHVVQDDRLVMVDGIRVTSLVRTTFDSVRLADFRSALALCDSALRVGRLTRDQLLNDFQSMGSHLMGRARACGIAALADPRPESGGESVARAVMLELGVMPPELQVPVGDYVDGLTDYRSDFGWTLLDGTKVLGEMDGREKYRNPVMTGGRDVVDVLADERLRESRLSASGAKIMRFSYAEATDPRRFTHILKAYGIPFGYPIPEVARTDPYGQDRWQ